MNKGKIEYRISNGNHCIRFLECMARGEYEEVHKNDFLNHSLAVYALIDLLRSLVAENEQLIASLRESNEKLRVLERGKVDCIVSSKFDEMKRDIIEYIEEYGKW